MRAGRTSCCRSIWTICLSGQPAGDLQEPGRWLGTPSAQLAVRHLRHIEIELPLPQEQRRILDLIACLEEVASCVAQTQNRAIDCSQRSARASSMRRMRRRFLGDLIADIQGGRSPVCAERVPTPDEWGVLKISAVQACGFDRDESKLLPETEEPFPDAQVRVGDVVITRSNTPDKVGMATYVDDDPGRVLLSDLIWRLAPRDGAVRPDYLAEALMTPRARAAVRATAAGTSGSMKKINRTKLRRLTITRPDPDEQERIAVHLADVRALCRANRSAVRTFHGTRLALINNLVSGRSSVAASYDRFLDDAGGLA